MVGLEHQENRGAAALLLKLRLKALECEQWRTLLDFRGYEEI